MKNMKNSSAVIKSIINGHYSTNDVARMNDIHQVDVFDAVSEILN